MSQEISATVRFANNISLSNTTNILRLRQLNILSYGETRSFQLWVCKDSPWHMLALPWRWQLTRPKQVWTVDWHFPADACVQWWSHHGAGVTCVRLAFSPFSCRHKGCRLLRQKFSCRVMHLKVLSEGSIALGCVFLFMLGRGCGRLENKHTLVSTVRQVGGFLLRAQQCYHCYQIPILGPPILGDA